MRGIVTRAAFPCAEALCAHPSRINYVRKPERLQPSAAIREALCEAVQDTADVEIPLLAVDASLRSWIQIHGGAVGKTLRLVDNAPCGCRGIITTASLPSELVQAVPLILVPESLYMTTDNARKLLQPLESKRFGLSFWHKELPGAVQLAVLLAMERRRGEDSFWAPYIRSLPSDVPCAWALCDDDLQKMLAALGPGAEDWSHAVAAARSSVHQRAEHAVKRYGKHLLAELSVEDVVWALGQVLSRSFGNDPDIALAPFIDLCNHRHGAPRPGGFVDERDGVSYAFIASSSNNNNSSCERVHALAAGEEVYISYVMAKADPLTTFLNLGFVPPELLPLRLGCREG
ncbi:hypothetical protein Vafri_3000 [Volvox africanus]|uniref:SET domain-containing protein n=1 Tax=Volvox africanus TaxID=51714 RepID=A0A8J4ARD8_9CHLO|nr:hypothetical protein Vafri_3000 [Volvox africanus]